MNSAGGTAPSANTAPAEGGVTAGMTPVQKDCWAIYNHPDAQARDSGVGTDEVIVHYCVLLCS